MSKVENTGNGWRSIIPVVKREPLVSAIIPSYNYRRFLKKRLKSVISQKGWLKEIIFLDDASTDGSVKFARPILKTSGIPYRIEINQKNSGSVFNQWQKGLSLSKGDWIWFAEADDACHPEFLDTLLPRMLKNKGTVLGYTDSQVINKKNQKIWPNFYKKIYSELHQDKWENDFINSGLDEIHNSLFVKNTIPNASAVLMNRKVLNSIGGIPQKWKLSGDWAVYLMLLELGDVVYSSQLLNYNRIHKNRVTEAFDTSKIFFTESLGIAEGLLKDFQIPLKSQKKYIHNFLRQLAHSRGKVSLSDGLHKQLKTVFSETIVDEVLVKYFDKLVREQKIKDCFSTRLKRITFNKIINRYIKSRI